MDPEIPPAPSEPAADPTPPAPPAATSPADPPAADPPAATDPPVADVGDDGKPRSQERIEELIAQNKAERQALSEYAEFWRQKALESGTPPAPVAPEKPDPAPKLGDFDSTEQWADAHAAWTDRQIEKRAATIVDQRLQTRDQQSQETAVKTSYHGRLGEFVKVKPDAVKVIGSPAMTAALKAQPVIGEVVMGSEVGPQLAYHLASADNRAELVRIQQLPPVQAAAAIGRIEAKLAVAAAAAPKPPAPKNPAPSNAPPPPTPIGGGGAPGINLATCSIQEYLDHRLGRKR